MVQKGVEMSPRIALFMDVLGGGGAERVIATLANGFYGAGYAVDVILVQHVGEHLNRVASKCFRDRTQVNPHYFRPVFSCSVSAAGQSRGNAREQRLREYRRCP